MNQGLSVKFCTDRTTPLHGGEIGGAAREGRDVCLRGTHEF